jgi:hypothetical protein
MYGSTWKQFAIRFGAAGRPPRLKLNHKLRCASTQLQASALMFHRTNHQVSSCSTMALRRRRRHTRRSIRYAATAYYSALCSRSFS